MLVSFSLYFWLSGCVLYSLTNPPPFCLLRSFHLLYPLQNDIPELSSLGPCPQPSDTFGHPLTPSIDKKIGYPMVFEYSCRFWGLLGQASCIYASMACTHSTSGQPTLQTYDPKNNAPEYSYEYSIYFEGFMLANGLATACLGFSSLPPPTTRLMRMPRHNLLYQ
ncbi:hypothetical protein CPB86DRAFT_456122 [Serendipita vermifera]|nr:hypothetical protein CPB86DRAFT_456122 [Serendipita vermifera]